MGASERSNKDKAMAAHLKSRGIYHGTRTTSARPNSGGDTMVYADGSAKNQRRDRAAEARRERERKRS